MNVVPWAAIFASLKNVDRKSTKKKDANMYKKYNPRIFPKGTSISSKAPMNFRGKMKNIDT